MSVPLVAASMNDFLESCELDSEMRTTNGRMLATFMLDVAKECQANRHLDDFATFPVPEECLEQVKMHRRMCGGDCDHDKQCGTNKQMWLPLEQQKQCPYAGLLSDDAASKMLKLYIPDVDRLRSDLREKLQSHGNIILKKWKKLSKDKRGLLLTRVSPRVFGDWPMEKGACTSPDCYDEHHYAWPPGHWLNVGDMAEDWMKLVSLLHVRTKHDGRSWALWDSRESTVWQLNDYLPAWFNRCCVAIYREDYGKLCDFDQELVHSRAIEGFPRAFMTIQAQHELLYTLNDVVDAIIDGAEGTGEAEWTALVADGLHPAGQNASWNAFSHQAFTDPVQFSAELLQQRANDRLNMIKDELLLMQTDPAYTQELIRSRRVATSNISQNLRRKDQLLHAAPLFMLELLSRFNMWQTISSRCSQLVQLFEHYKGHCKPGMHVDREITDRIDALKRELSAWMAAASDNFEAVVHFTRAFQHRYQITEYDGHVYVDETAKLAPDEPADRLRWRLKKLREYATGHGLATAGFSTSFAYMQRDEAKANIMDKPTQDHIADIMVLDEMRVQLSNSQRGKLDHNPDRTDSWARKVGKHGCIYRDDDCRAPKLSFDGSLQLRMGLLIQKFMDKPWPKGRKDLSWLAKATETRDQLASLWTGIVDEFVKAEKVGGQGSACVKQFAALLSTSTTDASYVAELERERELCKENSKQQELTAQRKAPSREAQVIQSDWGNTPAPEQASQKSVKHKTKSRPTIETVDDVLAQIHLEPHAVQAPVCMTSGCKDHTSEHEEPLKSDSPIMPVSVPVKKDNLAVFQKMYRANAENLTGSTIRWQLFVQAMKDAGFKAEEAAGSAVSFRDASGKSICFHRPHPDPVLTHIMLYAMARRMTKWFGFSPESFVLREKDEAVGEA